MPAPTSISPAVTGCNCARKTHFLSLRLRWKGKTWVGQGGGGCRYSRTEIGSEPPSAPRAGHIMTLPCHQPHMPPAAVSPATHQDHACHISCPVSVAPRPAAMVCALGWCQVQLTSPERGPAALAASPHRSGPPGDVSLGLYPRFPGLAAPPWEWLAERPSGPALPGSGHQAQRHGSVLAEPIAFQKPTSEAQFLCMDPAVSAGAGGGLSARSSYSNWLQPGPPWGLPAGLHGNPSAEQA